VVVEEDEVVGEEVYICLVKLVIVISVCFCKLYMVLLLISDC
jgi:hypothetical protein